MTRKRTMLLLFGIALAVLIPAGMAIADGRGELDGSVPATAKFHDIDVATAAGYSVTVEDLAKKTCIAQAGAGGMGVHRLDPTLLDDKINPLHPEALVYEPTDNGGMKLVALEYIVFKSAWEAAHGVGSVPSLFGQPFMLTPAGNRFGLPDFFALHSWIWKPNPSGLFQPWNPRVVCP
jgi:hypothetical protein